MSERTKLADCEAGSTRPGAECSEATWRAASAVRERAR
jgi:hypothetical protein